MITEFCFFQSLPLCPIRYGVVLRKLDLVKEAIDVFVEATHILPLHWGAWLELCNLITDKETVNGGITSCPIFVFSHCLVIKH